MDRSELRIGNLLHTSIYQDTEEAKEDLGNEYSEEKEWIVDTVEGVCQPNEDYLYWGSNGYEDGTYRTKGIEITKEWLLKFGFLEQIGFSKFIGEKYKNSSIELAHNDSDKWYLYFRNFNSGLADDFVLLRNNIKHIHQVQNLYHALTGEELTYEHSN